MSSTSESPHIVENVPSEVNWSIVGTIVVVFLSSLIATCLYYCHSKRDQGGVRELLTCCAPEPPNPDVASRTKTSRTSRSRTLNNSSRLRDSSLYKKINELTHKNTPFFFQHEFTENTCSEQIPLPGVKDAGQGQNVSRMSRGVGNDINWIDICSLNNLSGVASQSMKDNMQRSSYVYENLCTSVPAKLTGPSASSQDLGLSGHSPTSDDRKPALQTGYNSSNFVSSDSSCVYSLDAIDISSIVTCPELNLPPAISHHKDYLASSVGCSPRATMNTDASASLSLPSSLSRFHASKLYNTLPVTYHQAGTRNSPNFTVTGCIDVTDFHSDNTSLQPFQGSSASSTGIQASSKWNSKTSCSSCTHSYDNMGFESEPSSLSADTTDAEICERFVLNQSCNRSIAECSDVNPTFSRDTGVLYNYSSDVNRVVTIPPHPRHDYTSIASVLNDGSLYSSSQYLPVHHTQQSDGSLVVHVNQPPTPIKGITNRRVPFSVPILNKKQYWV